MDYKERAQELCEKFEYNGNEKEAFLHGYRVGSMDAQIDDLRQQIEFLKEICKICNSARRGNAFPDAETR